MTDYASALWIPNGNFFPDSGKKSFLILHGTAGGSSALSIAQYFQSTEGTSNPVSSNYIVDQAGIVAQTVLEKDGAYAQGVVNNSNWLGNPNNYCLSIEHVKSSTDNSEPLTSPQQAASFALIKDICVRNNIGMHDADNSTGITGHFSIDPVNRARCPGTFPWNELWTYLKGGNTPMQPTSAEIFAANKRWGSLTNTPKGTGIYKSWLSHYISGVFHGPPLSKEYPSKDWAGNPIIVQEFTYGWCEWNGTANWYGPNGKIA